MCLLTLCSSRDKYWSNLVFFRHRRGNTEFWWAFLSIAAVSSLPMIASLILQSRDKGDNHGNWQNKRPPEWN